MNESEGDDDSLQEGESRVDNGVIIRKRSRRGGCRGRGSSIS